MQLHDQAIHAVAILLMASHLMGCVGGQKDTPTQIARSLTPVAKPAETIDSGLRVGMSFEDADQVCKSKGLRVLNVDSNLREAIYHYVKEGDVSPSLALSFEKLDGDRRRLSEWAVLE